MKEIKRKHLILSGMMLQIMKSDMIVLSVFSNVKFLFGISNRVNNIFLSLWKCYCLKYVSLPLSFTWKGK